MSHTMIYKDGVHENSITFFLVKASADTINGVATILIKIPADGRYIRSGSAWFTASKHKNDSVSMSLVDQDNILGYGSGFVLSSFDDLDVNIENQGSIISIHSGELTALLPVNPMYIQGGFYIRAIGTKGDLSVDTLCANMTWGALL